MNKQLIMSWSECTIEAAKSVEGYKMPTTLTDLGVVNENSAQLNATDGDAMEAYGSGHVLVSREMKEGGYELTLRVKEPDDSLYTTLFGIGTAVSTDTTFDAGTDESDAVDVATHVVTGDFAVKLTPKNVGGKGVKAPHTSVSFKPGHSEEEGHFVDITFSFLKTKVDNAYKWYRRFTKKAVTE